MIKKILVSIIASAAGLAVLPAGAMNWSEKVDLCAAAVEAEGLATVSDYRVKFVSAGGGATKRLQIKLTPNAGGDTLIAECKIRRGEVTEVNLKA